MSIPTQHLRCLGKRNCIIIDLRDYNFVQIEPGRGRGRFRFFLGQTLAGERPKINDIMPPSPTPPLHVLDMPGQGLPRSSAVDASGCPRHRAPAYGHRRKRATTPFEGPRIDHCVLGHVSPWGRCWDSGPEEQSPDGLSPNHLGPIVPRKRRCSAASRPNRSLKA